VRSRKPRPGGFGHHVRRYYGRCAGCIRWTGTGARRVTPPRAASQETCHKQPGLKSKSRGLETSTRAAAERREASAAEAGGPCERMVRGARRARSANGWQRPLAWRGQFFSLRLPALRLPLFYLEAKQQWLSFLLQNSGADAPRGRSSSPSPGGGGSRTAGARGGVRGCAGIRSALRALSPHPAALRASTFPLQGKVKRKSPLTRGRKERKEPAVRKRSEPDPKSQKYRDRKMKS